MTRFGPDPKAFFDAVYQESAPWDVGSAQPALSALFDEFPPESPVLDVGCGSGDLAIALAQRGLQVLGIDFVEAAIEQAREKAAAFPAEVARLVDFEVADALQPSQLQQSFASIVDSGFFHLLDPEQAERFVEELASTLPPGGRYYLLAFDVEFDIPHAPRQISAAEVRARFTPEKGWRILELRPAEFLSRFAPTPATCACIERPAL